MELQNLSCFLSTLNSQSQQVVQAFAYWRVYSGASVLIWNSDTESVMTLKTLFHDNLLYFREDEYLVNMQHTVIPSWYQREGYIKAMADLIQKELGNFDCPEEVIPRWRFYMLYSFCCTILKLSPTSYMIE